MEIKAQTGQCVQGHTTIKGVCDFVVVVVQKTEEAKYWCSILFQPCRSLELNICLFLYACRDEERGKEDGRKRYFEKLKVMTSQFIVNK